MWVTELVFLWESGIVAREDGRAAQRETPMLTPSAFEQWYRMKGSLSKMSYFPDLSPYTYYLKFRRGFRGGHQPKVTTLNIGWLERGKPFPTGEPGWPDQVFLENLALFEQYPVNPTKCWHACEFCESFAGGISSAEIRVLGSDGIVYAAPSMLGHYIRVHRYKPPEQFIQAVLHGPRPPLPPDIIGDEP